MTTATEYALMAGAAYRSTRDPKNRFPIPQGWNQVSYSPPAPSGFEAVSFTNGTDIVISYAGTDESSLGDIAADFNLLIGIGSKQLLQAAKYYLQVKATNPAAANITFTGHSLGGGLAALMGAFFNEDAFTFNQAPFRNSASSLVANALLVKLRSAFPVSDYPQIASWLAPLEGFAQDGLAAREGNVTNINVQGEFLSF